MPYRYKVFSIFCCAAIWLCLYLQMDEARIRVLDNSRSMKQQLDEVNQNFQTLAQQFNDFPEEMMRCE